MVKGGGMHGEGEHAWQRGHVGHAWNEGGYAWQGGVYGKGGCMQRRRPLKRAVLILLECILVTTARVD